MPSFRLLKYGLALFGIATGVIFIARLPGTVIVRLNEADYLVSVPIILTALIFLSIFSGLVVWIVRWVWRLPAKNAAARKARRLRVGQGAMMDGYLALTRKDGDAAYKLLRRAQMSMPDDPLPRLMAFDLALQREDHKGAAQLLADIIRLAPKKEHESRFRLALAQNDLALARQALDAGALEGDQGRWSLRASFELAVREARWTQAQAFVGQMARSGLITKQDARRFRGLLYLEDLRQNGGDLPARQKLAQAERAAKLLPDFPPAVTAHAEALAETGNVSKAQLRLKQAWRHAPHPDLATCFLHVSRDLPLEEQAQLARKLGQGQVDHVETALLRASLAVRAHRWAQAEQLLASFADLPRPPRRVCQLMADIRAGEEDEGAARAWLSRALSADQEAQWHADGLVLPAWQASAPVSGRFDAVQWGVIEHVATPALPLALSAASPPASSESI